jgi:hypothetical protein
MSINKEDVLKNNFNISQEQGICIEGTSAPYTLGRPETCVRPGQPPIQTDIP